MDISYVEESGQIPDLTVALLPKSEQIVLIEMNSRLHMDHLSKLMEAANKACHDVYLVLDRAVRDHVSEAWQLMNN